MVNTIRWILELQNEPGSNAKQEIIRAHTDNDGFKMLLYYALHPTLTYGVSEKALEKTEQDEAAFKNTGLFFFDNIFTCCEFLSRVSGVSDEILREVKLFLYEYCNEEERDVYIKLLAKTLRLGVTAKTVNKVIPNLIPTWEVQQAYPIEKYQIPDGAEFWLTQKLNGVRATLVDGALYARSGAIYRGVEHITKELKWAEAAGLVLDGELTLKDRRGLSDNEAFRIATGILNSDDDDKTGICFTIFDAVPEVDFFPDACFFSTQQLPCKMPYSQRRTILDGYVSQKLCSGFAQYVSVLPVLYHGTDQSKIGAYLDQMVREDKEGLMANLDVPYKKARHKGILKIKRFYTMDLPILRCEEGTGRLAGTLGALVVGYKDNEVKVGTGFTDEQRDQYWQQREALEGTLCEVKYKEISSDKKTGLESLQFPVFVRLRTDKTEVSYG